MTITVNSTKHVFMYFLTVYFFVVLRLSFQLSRSYAQFLMNRFVFVLSVFKLRFTGHLYFFLVV